MTAKPKGTLSGAEQSSHHQVRLEPIKSIEMCLKTVEGLIWYEVEGLTSIIVT